MTSDALVVVHCVDLRGSALERRLSSVAAGLPDHVEIIATTSVVHRRSTALQGRVVLQSVTDGGYGIVNRAVRAGRLVVTVPTTAEVSGRWFEAAATRSEGSSRVCVLVCGDEGLFVFPAGVGDVNAQRTEWRTAEGVSLMAASRSQPRATSLGAVLIVKDEEEVLPACLAALRDVVDEVVIYDTGSTDETVSIARAAGARVVEGSWDHDFGAARNRALESSTTEWVLSVDADEILECSADELRRWLSETEASAAMVPQVSTNWSGAESGFEINVVRLFRRTRGRWKGALHEVVVPIDPRTWSLSPVLAPLRLMHSGFRTDSTEGKDKGTRNAGIALSIREGAREGSIEWLTATAHYGRSLALGGHFDAALEELSALLEHDVPPVVMLPAARVAAQLLVGDPSRAASALPWIDRAEAVGESAGQVALWRSRVAIVDGDWWEAADLLAGLDHVDADGGVDLWGTPFDITLTVTAMADIDLLLGMAHEALGRMQAVLHAAPDRVKVSVLFNATLAAGFSLRDLVREAPAAFHSRSLRTVFEDAPDIALAWFTAMADELPGDRRPVVAASVAAARTGILEALEWSVRAREADCGDICALRMLGEDEALPASARLLAWAVLLHGFHELDAVDGVMRMLELVDAPERAAALESLRVVAPGAIDLTTVDARPARA